MLRAQRKGNCIYLEESKDTQSCRENDADQGAKRVRSSHMAEDGGSSKSMAAPAKSVQATTDMPAKNVQASTDLPAKNVQATTSAPAKNSQHHRMCYWGYRLEAISTLDQHPERTEKLPQLLSERIHATVNTNIQYCTVVKTRLGRRSIIMGAEVDCTRDDKVPNDACRNYLELKTNKVLESDRDRRTFERFKLLKIYFQSFLASIPRGIFCIYVCGCVLIPTVSPYAIVSPYTSPSAIPATLSTALATHLSQSSLASEIRVDSYGICKSLKRSRSHGLSDRRDTGTQVCA